MLLGVSSSTFCISWNCIQKYNSSGSLQKPRTIDHRWFVSAFWKFVDLIHFHANFWGDFHVLGSTQHWLTVFTSSTHRIPFLWHSQWTQCWHGWSSQTKTIMQLLWTNHSTEFHNNIVRSKKRTQTIGAHQNNNYVPRESCDTNCNLYIECSCCLRLCRAIRVICMLI